MNVLTIKNQNSGHNRPLLFISFIGYDYHYITEKNGLYVTRSHAFIIYINSVCIIEYDNLLSSLYVCPSTLICTYTSTWSRMVQFVIKNVVDVNS